MALSKCCESEVVVIKCDDRYNATCKSCYYPCDIKPMKHEVKVGDRFKLINLTWLVRKIDSEFFYAHTVDTILIRRGSMSLKDADQLDWIKPEPTFTKEQVEAIKEKLEQGYPPNVGDLFVWLDSHTEKE